eukprot:RCo049609
MPTGDEDCGRGNGTLAAANGCNGSITLLGDGCSSSSATANGGETYPPKMDPSCIRDVWANNLAAEMERISKVVEKFPYISMDTEFPGVVVQPVNPLSNYSRIQCNVNLLKIIQLGLTFSDEEGRHPPGICTWQFNFKFDISMDMYAQDSIELLQSSGLDFHRHNQEGIDVAVFGEMLTTSGLVLNDDIKWISFHSSYDFGYLIKILTNAGLPDDEDDFFELVAAYFYSVYDIKYIMKMCSSLNHKAGLSQLATDLCVERVGPIHQAGSDSLITCHTFFKMIKTCLKPFCLRDSRWKNVLYGLGKDAAQSSEWAER